MENKVGSVGFISLLFPFLMPMALIKVDPDTGREVRDENGLCIVCKPGEPGEFVGRIIRFDPARDFQGYVGDASATKKKIICDVKRKGDSFFRSGDILVMDELGWLSFKDRTGDTFRWKGENVSSAEVEATVSNVVQLRDAVVYGVSIPGVEGRAGMAAIHDPSDAVNLGSLALALKEQLPSFARPLFVRLVADSLDLTGTFKMKKVKLQSEGFDPEVTAPDRTYFLNPSSGQYQLIDKDLFSRIVNGEIRI